MGLYSTLNDASFDSIDLLLVALAAHGVRYLRSLLLHFLHSTRLLPVDGESESLSFAVCSGLAGVIALAEQLNVGHRAFTCRDRDGMTGSECVVCLCRLSEGDRLPRLACSHVFHRDCLDGWLDYCNLSCPLCRAPLASEERVLGVERHVWTDLVTLHLVLHWAHYIAPFDFVWATNKLYRATSWE